MKKPFRLSTGNPRSTSTAAIVPSTFRIRFSFFEDVTFSTSRAKSRCGVLIPRLFTYPTSSCTRLSGLRTLLTRCPMPGTSPTVFFMYARKSSADILLSTACLNQRPASVTAPPKRGPIMIRPAATDWDMPMPAQAAMIVPSAPLTQGPWSAESIMMRLMISASCLEIRRLSQSSPITCGISYPLLISSEAG